MTARERGRGASHRRWQAPWLLAIAAIVSLPLAWSWWSVERVSARAIQQLQQRSAASLPLEAQVSSRIRQWQSSQAATSNVQDRIRVAGEEPGQWQRRTITIESQRMSRAEAERYLRDLTNNERSVFMPSVIHLKAAKASESVFSVHQGQDSADALQVTIKADLYTRAAR